MNILKINSNKINMMNDDNSTIYPDLSQNSTSDKPSKSTSNSHEVKLSKHKSKNHDSFSKDNASKNIEQPLASNLISSLSNNTSDELASKIPALYNNTLDVTTQNSPSKYVLKSSSTSDRKKGNTNLNPLHQKFTSINSDNDHKIKINNNIKLENNAGLNTKINNRF